MPTIQTIAAFLDAFAPPQLAEAWDNVGLLVGDGGGEARRVMTCLTMTPATVAEAVEHARGPGCRPSSAAVSGPEAA